jgi:hypothetical protein
MIPTVARIIFLQLLPNGMGLPPDNRIFSGRIIGAAPEHFVGEEVFVDLS